MDSVYKQFQISNKSTEPRPLLGTSTFRNLMLDRDSAIFSKVRINFNPSHQVTHLVTNNNHLVFAMSNKVLVRIDLLVPNDKEEIDLSKFANPQAKIHRLFLDPTGQHLVITVVSKDNCTPVDVLYLPWKTTRPKISSRLKDMVITAIAWNLRNISDSTTGQILIGTSRGLILEVELTSDEKLLQTGFEKNFKQIFDLSTKEVNLYITALEATSNPNDSLNYLVLCATVTKLIYFTGYVKSLDERPFYTSVFQNYLGVCNKNFIEHANPWKDTWLQLSYIPNSKILKTLVWLVDEVIHIEEVNWSELSQSSKSEFRHLPEQCESGVSPCGLIVTQFHILITYPQKIVAMCLLNNQVIFEDTIPEECGRVVGICRDLVKGTIWMFAERGIFKYKVGKEDQNIWQIYLEQGNFHLAEKHCRNDEFALSLIIIKEAEEYFKNSNYTESAKLFSKIPSSFEEICLKFIDAKAEDGLMVYLREKLNNAKADEQNQTTILVMWILELHLKKLGDLRDSARRDTEEYHHMDNELKAFLRDVKVRQCVNQNSSAVYSLLASHDDQDNYVGVALVMKDFNRVVLHLMAHQRYVEALEVMSTQFSEKLFYQHTSALLKVIPKETVDALIAQGHRLNPVILLPTLIHAHASYERSVYILSYIEFCIDKLDIKEKLFHNFLITLYCCHNPDKLLTYLKVQGDDINSVNYDTRYALKECAIAGLDKASVHILTTMGLYQEAVEMALKVDLSLAKAIANRTRYNEDLCKKLWLMIAAHVVDKEHDVSKAMGLLKECSLIKIENILPFFPDFVTIDQFKDAICKSLQEYNEHITALKEEMEDATKTAASIRSDMKKFRQKHFVIKAEDCCAECNFPLMMRSFYLFPCSHKFHQDCLTDAVMNFLSVTKQKQVSDLKGRLIALTSNERTVKENGSNLWSEREQIKQKIDAIVAKECLYCGEIAVNSIDMPFIFDEEWNSVLEEWQ